MGNQFSKRRHKIDSNSSLNFNTPSFQDGATSMHSQPNFPQYSLYFPRDEDAIARHQKVHYLLKHVFQRSYFAPVDSALKNQGAMALDVGCGAYATWAVDMANDFPNATFYAIDLLDPFPPEDALATEHVPKNLSIDVTNVLDGLQFPNNTFDYVHQRIMCPVYHGDDIGFVMRELKRVTKPGGWVDLIEPDLLPKRAGPLMKNLSETIYRYQKKIQDHMFVGPRIRRFLVDSGFVDVNSDYVSIPLCWGGFVGKNMYEAVLSGYRKMGPFVYRELLGEKAGEYYDEEQFEAYMDKAFDECVEYQTFFNIYWASGRKPQE